MGKQGLVRFTRLPGPCSFFSISLPFSLLSSDWKIRGRIKMGTYTEIFESEVIYQQTFVMAHSMQNSLLDSKRF